MFKIIRICFLARGFSEKFYLIRPLGVYYFFVEVLKKQRVELRLCLSLARNKYDNRKKSLERLECFLTLEAVLVRKV